MTTSTFRIAVFGASHGCANEAVLALLRRPQDAKPLVEVHALLRGGAAKLNATMAKAGFTDPNGTPNTRIVAHTGDATDASSVRGFFTAILNTNGSLDAVVSSVGSLPHFKWNSLFVPPRLLPGTENVCADSMRIIIDALEQVVAPRQADRKAPRLIVVSSNAIGKSGHDVLPLALKPLYGWYLQHPHADKHNMEQTLHARYAIESADFGAKKASSPSPALPSDRLIIVRPSVLTDGDAKLAVRTSKTTLRGAWTVSRADVGHFLAGDCLRLTAPISKEAVQGGTAVVVSY